ncbi:MAG TPA: hypothetical protein PLA12_13990 [Candidatus Hydrogenedens sp.]|nr:hypothetical protein [Candidatus Hydrogenedens sp.]
MLKRTLIALTFVMLITSFVVLAQDANKETEQPVGVTITGENISLFETYAKGGTASANSALAQLNALKVTEAKDVDGKALDDLKEKVLIYLPTKEADSLLTGNQMRGKTVKIIGKLFKQANAILVETIEGGDNSGDDFDKLPVGSKSQLQVL